MVINFAISFTSFSVGGSFYHRSKQVKRRSKGLSVGVTDACHGVAAPKITVTFMVRVG
jgi:hypothetical protein